MRRIKCTKCVRYVKCINPARVLIMLVLGLIALLACSPVLFLLCGGLMDAAELRDHLGPVLAGARGYADWPLLPRYPSLRPAAELFLDTPEYFGAFWNSCLITGGILAGQLLVGAPAAWGFARFDFPLRGALFALYIVLMLMPFQVTMLSAFLALDRLSTACGRWFCPRPSPPSRCS